ncbi:LuxR C-terminal-related transcriptional regulator [Enterobacter asburiae]|uniref:helix-turn-helix transcriptional regulator n=1 Tax=Scandinavium sp. UTDF21-P1B TaxID=3446379 RepID=UPI00346D14E9
MIKILIRDRNRYFQQGMENILEDFGLNRLHKKICFEYLLSRNTISEANIIVMDLQPGEGYLCHFDLCRYRKGIFLGIQEREMPSIHRLPNCFRNASIITRNTPMQSVRQEIVHAWETYQPDLSVKCSACTCKFLSKQQLSLMRLMLDGKNEKEIADRLNITVATIFSYKYQIMKNFSLKNNQELNAFIRSYLLHPW